MKIPCLSNTKINKKGKLSHIPDAKDGMLCKVDSLVVNVEFSYKLKTICQRNIF